MTAIHCVDCGLTLTAEQAGAPCPQCGSRARNLTVEQTLTLTHKVEVAKVLAGRHYSAEPAVTEIFTVWSKPEREALPGEPLKLLEVNRDTIASGVMPLGFDAAPASGVPFPSVIIEVTPEEMRRIAAKELSLPHGWVLGEYVPRRPGATGSTSCKWRSRSWRRPTC